VECILNYSCLTLYSAHSQKSFLNIPHRMSSICH
jgi:hypothetical protein